MFSVQSFLVSFLMTESKELIIDLRCFVQLKSMGILSVGKPVGLSGFEGSENIGE